MPTTQDDLFTALDLPSIRSQFPSFAETVNGHPAAYLDGPGGTQVPQRVIDAITDYLKHANANTCGAYLTSRRTNEAIASARAAMADFFGCDSDEIVFGFNMTSLTYAMSRAIGRELVPGDEIVVTLLDHDANFSPWKALEERGVVVRQVDINPSDCTLDMEDLKQKINSRTKIVAVGYAANAVGAINDVHEVVQLAHAVGALAFIDAVHYAPHGPVDVRQLDCDFLVCSSYKFFGPHLGIMYGKAEHLKQFRPYKVRPQYDSIPDRWETGTQNHECLEGLTAAIDYLAKLGSQAALAQSSRRSALMSAYQLIRAHERELVAKLISGLLKIRGLRFYGVSNPA